MKQTIKLRHKFRLAPSKHEEGYRPAHTTCLCLEREKLFGQYKKRLQGIGSVKGVIAGEGMVILSKVELQGKRK